MSQFQNALPGGVRRNTNQAAGIRRGGVTAAPVAPGLVPQPAVSVGVQRAGQLAEILGLTGAVAAQVGRQARRETYQRERDAAETANQYRGQASLDTRTEISEVQRRVGEGEFDNLIDQEGDISDAVAGYIDQQLVDDDGEPVFPDAYAEAYRRQMLPAFTDAVVRRQAELIEDARGESLRLESEGAFEANTPDGFALALANAATIAPDLTESERLNAVVVPSLRIAAESGDLERFDSAAAALGNRFPELRSQLRAELEVVRRSDDAKAARDRFNTVQNRVASTLNEDRPNFEIASEIVSNADIDESDKLRLSGLIERERSESTRLATVATQERVQSVIDTNPSVGRLRESVNAIAAQSAVFKEADAARVVDRYARSQIELAAAQGDFEAVARLAPELDGSPDAAVFTQQANEAAASNFRRITTESIVSRVLTNEISGEQAVSMAQEGATRFNENPNDPRALRPAHVQTILSSIRQKETADIRDQQVTYRLRTGNGVLTEGKHASSFNKKIGPEGLGLIGPANNVTDGQSLAVAVAQAGITTPDLRATLTQSLATGNAKDATQAAIAIGGIAQDRERWAELLDAVGEDMAAALEETRDAYARGQFNDHAAAKTALDNIRTLRERQPDLTQPRQRALDTLKRADPDFAIEEKATELLDAAREERPYTKDFGALGFDRLNADPDRQPASPEISGTVSRWFTDHYATLINRNVPNEIALQKAEVYARGKIDKTIDYVRWDDTITPTMITNGKNTLPAELRWADGFEEEAAREMREMHGLDPADVLAVVPYYGDESDSPGWSFLDATTGQLMTFTINHPPGRPVVKPFVFRPSIGLRDSSVRSTRAIQAKQKEFEESGGYGLLDYLKLGSSGNMMGIAAGAMSGQ